MTLKDKMDGYAPQPDEKVWQRVSDTLRRRALVRKVAIMGSVAAVAAVLVVVLLPKKEVAPVAAKSVPVVVRHNEIEEKTLAQSDVVVRKVAVEATQNVRIEDNVQVAAAMEAQPVPTQLVGADVDDGSSAGTDVGVEESKRSDSRVDEPKKTLTETAVTPQNAETSKLETSSKVGRRNTAPDELMVFIPNAFSPNDPSSEEVRTFRVFPNNDADISNFKIYIYNRGGRQVFHSSDITHGWDGKTRGVDQPMGTYVYVVEYTDAAKGLQHVKGTLTLIR